MTLGVYSECSQTSKIALPLKIAKAFQALLFLQEAPS